MAITKRELIQATRALSKAERSEFIAELSRAGNVAGTAEANRFWEKLPIDEPMTEGQRIVRGVGDLQASFWPEDENIDDFVAFVRRQREADRTAGS